MRTTFKICVLSAIHLLIKAYPIIALLGRSNLVRRYLENNMFGFFVKIKFLKCYFKHHIFATKRPAATLIAPTDKDCIERHQNFL
jgi:hypothetical protein